MTTEKAIEVIDEVKKEVLIDLDLDCYLAFELAKRSLEREIPILRRLGGNYSFFCPVCKVRVKRNDNYCWNCGKHFKSEDERYE